jgi:hypothetical protein
MLTCHKDIIIVPECGFSVWLYDKYRDWVWDEAGLIDRFIPDLYDCRKFETWQLDKEELIEFIVLKEPSSYAALASAVYEYFGVSRGESFHRWGDKNNHYVQSVVKIKEIFSDAVFIHIIRDGRDVACSYLELAERHLEGPYAPRLPTAIEDIAREWRDNVAGVVEAMGTVGSENFCEIRFEDLIADTETVLRLVCEFLEEDFDPNMLDYHVENQRKALEPETFLAWKEKTLSPPLTSVVGRYVRDLPPDDVQKFEKTAGALLQQFGYLEQ